jgi:hypothetical protein
MLCLLFYYVRLRAGGAEDAFANDLATALGFAATESFAADASLGVDTSASLFAPRFVYNRVNGMG